MIGTESQKLQIIRQHACNVSRALWPANIRQSVVTGKAYYSRKQTTNKKMRWLASDISLPLSVITTATMLGSLLLVAFLLRAWYLLFLLPMVLVLTVIASLFLHHAFKQRTQTPSSQVWDNIVERKSFPGIPFSAMRNTPQTPMPAEPLVRVLETFDLSESDVEHFVNSAKYHALVERVSSHERITSFYH
ncbi:MAG: hypothetical protein M3Z24_13120 [Chloroflexota bacterium]|nr:hypothetical protein [Chloroflexota bacterium]